MTTDEIRAQLVDLCRKHVLDAKRAVLSEPYVPFLPDAWNGLLVVAEAQNLSKTNEAYVERLRSVSSSERIDRLRLASPESTIGIQPWDDGSLKLAVESAIDLRADETAVSNAVLWSVRSDDDYNDNPSFDLSIRSIALWAAMLTILQPRRVVAAGAWARDVMTKAISAADLAVTPTLWILPSRRLLSPFSPMVNQADLLRRFPEVKAVLDRHPEWVKGSYPNNKILYACLAVSATAAQPAVAADRASRRR
jgi:hypothetical protein